MHAGPLAEKFKKCNHIPSVIINVFYTFHNPNKYNTLHSYYLYYLLDKLVYNGYLYSSIKSNWTRESARVKRSINRRLSIMVIKKLYKATVSAPNNVAFPIDMLRYDNCHPSASDDGIRMSLSIKKDKGFNSFSLTTTKQGGFTTARWKSFGWTVGTINTISI